MYIARILYPVKVLGPGNRIGIWFSGCPRRCKGCMSPELWEQEERYRISLTDVKQMIGSIVKENPVDGFTLSGGDPLYQPEAFLELTEYLHTVSKDILVYTGYTREEIDPALLKYIGVLIDGPYVEKENHGSVLRGSDNQNVIVLDHGLEQKYADYLSFGKNEVQNFVLKDDLVTVGIQEKLHRK